MNDMGRNITIKSIHQLIRLQPNKSAKITNIYGGFNSRDKILIGSHTIKPS